MAKIEIELVNGDLAGKSFQEIKKSVNGAALELSKAKTGTDEWVKASLKLQDAKELQKDYTKQLEGTTKASTLLKESFNKLPGAQFFNQIGDSFGSMKKGVGGLISQFGLLKTAIASSGIGLLVLLLGSLVAWFTKTEDGADKLKSVLYPLQVLFQKLTGILADLGGKVFKRLGEAIENPKQALKDLGQILLDNVINRFKAFALIGPAIQKIFSKDWAEGLKDLGNATIQMGTGIENAIDKIIDVGKGVSDIFSQAYQDGQDLLRLENEIEDAEIALTKSRAKLNVEIAKNGEIARDTLETDEKRLEAAKQVQVLQAQLTAQEENLLRLRRERQKIEQNQDGHISDEERLAAAQLEAEIVQLQADNIDKNKKARALELNLIESIAKREAEIAKNLADLKVQAMKEGQEKEIAEIELHTDQKIEALTGSAEQVKQQKVLLEEIEGNEIQAIKDKYAAQAKATEDKKAADAIAAAKKSQEEQAKLAQQQADFENNMASLRLDTQQGVVSGLGDLLQTQIKDEKAAKKIKKSIGIAEIGFNLGKELSANALTSAANPLNAVSFGAAGAAQLAALNLKSILFAGINLAKVALFEKGGLVSGPSHAQGGIKGFVRSTRQPIEFEGGEFFFSRRATAALGADNLTRINDHYTRRFANGGPVSPYSSRGPISSGQSSSDSSAAAGVNEMKSLMMELIASTDRRFDRLRVENVATETQAVAAKVDNIIADADV